MKLIDFFDKGVARDAGRVFAMDDTNSITYREAQTRSRCMAAALRREGIDAGTRVAVFSANTAIACQCVVGLLRAGCIWVTVAPGGTAEEIARTLKNTDTRVLLYGASFEGKIGAIADACPFLRLTLCMDGEGTGRSLDSFVDRAPESFETAPGQPDQVATLFNSGGTTGSPKGVMMTSRAWELLVASSLINVGHDRPVKLLVSPISHTAGAVTFLADLALGATHVLLERFDPDRVLAAIEEHKVTSLFLPPTAINILLTHPSVSRCDYSSLRYVIYGGAPIAPARVREAMDVFGPVMATGFAQTETGGPVTFMTPADHVRARAERPERFASCGRETLFARVGVMDDEDRLLPVDSEGEIVVRSNHLMKGYFVSDTSEPLLSLTSNGWYRTGDVGFRDADGFVYLRDRRREMIISRGYNIFPADIERVIEGEPGVRACAVVGVPDDDMGELVVAVVEESRDGALDLNELLAACRRSLSAQNMPASIEVWRELPRSSAGKVLRRQVRDAFWQGRARKI